MSERCPRCVAERVPVVVVDSRGPYIAPRKAEYACGTFVRQDGSVEQSAACRQRQDNHDVADPYEDEEKP